MAIKHGRSHGTNEMTLREAQAYLATTDYPFSPITMKKAISAKKLRAKKVDAPVAYYVITQADLLEWASNTSHHIPGRKVNR